MRSALVCTRMSAAWKQHGQIASEFQEYRKRQSAPSPASRRHLEPRPSTTRLKLSEREPMSGASSNHLRKVRRRSGHPYFAGLQRELNYIDLLPMFFPFHTSVCTNGSSFDPPPDLS